MSRRHTIQHKHCSGARSLESVASAETIVQSTVTNTQQRCGRVPPPIKSFTGEDPPSLARVSDWNGWTAAEKLMQLPGYLKDRHYKNGDCWRENSSAGLPDRSFLDWILGAVLVMCCGIVLNMLVFEVPSCLS